MDNNTLIHKIFSGEPVFVAEIGLNHNGNPEQALLHVEAAARGGADAVKFQTFVPELMVSRYADSLLKEEREGEPDYSTIEFFRKLVLTGDTLDRVKQRAIDNGVVFFSSPFDIPSVELLESMEVPLYKVASSEVTNHHLLERIARTGKPVLMSTGMSSINDIRSAVEVMVAQGNDRVVLLHCVSKYPVPPEQAGLKKLGILADAFSCPVGFSDHSRGSTAAMCAAAAGARVFEKHFKLEENYACPDASVSLTPDEFSGFIDDVCQVVAMMGAAGDDDSLLADAETAKGARRSLFSSTFLKVGHVIQPGDIVCKRPGVGIPAYRLEEYTGKTVRTDIPEDYLIRDEYFK